MISLNMIRKFYKDDTIQNSKVSYNQYNKKFYNHNKVDINILLNRVKVQKKETIKKNIIFLICTLVGLSVSAYLIFN